MKRLVAAAAVVALASALPASASAPVAVPPILTDVAGDANGLAQVGVSHAGLPVNVAEDDLLRVDLDVPRRGVLRLVMSLAALPKPDDPKFFVYLLDATVEGCRFSLGALVYGKSSGPVAIADAEGGCTSDDQRVFLAMPSDVAPARLDAATKTITIEYSLYHREGLEARLKRDFGPGQELTGIGARSIDGEGAFFEYDVSQVAGTDKDHWAGVTMDAATTARTSYTIQCSAAPEDC